MVKNIILLLLLVGSVQAQNDNFDIVRINADFTDTWQALNDEVEKYHYKTAYLQRCDFALNERHYKSDKYRILFFGEYEKMEYLSRKYPTIVPFLPLKVVVMEDGESTILMNNPIAILLDITSDEDDKLINKWQQDITAMFAEIKAEFK